MEFNAAQGGWGTWDAVGGDEGQRWIPDPNPTFSNPSAGRYDPRLAWGTGGRPAGFMRNNFPTVNLDGEDWLQIGMLPEEWLHSAQFAKSVSPYDKNSNIFRYDDTHGQLVKASAAAPIIDELNQTQAQKNDKDFWNNKGPALGFSALAALGGAAAFGGGGAFGAYGSAAAADAAGLAQMALDAGLTGPAAQAFISSGGTLGSTAAGGLAGLEGGAEAVGTSGSAGAGGEVGNQGIWDQIYQQYSKLPPGIGTALNALTNSGGSDLTGQGLSNLANPQNSMLYSTPGMSSPGTGGSGSSWFSSLLNSPSTLLQAGGIVGGMLASSGAAKTQADAAREAAAAQLQAAGQSNALQEKIYNQTRADLEPWRLTGVNALAKLNQGGMSMLGQDPGYAFRLSEGMKALERSAAARGGLLSGSALKGITRYGQDYASNEYGNAFNRQASLAGIGQTANTQAGQAGQNYASSVGNNYMNAASGAGNYGTQAANAQASGYIGSANALSGGVNNALNAYQQNQLLSRLIPNYQGGY